MTSTTLPVNPFAQAAIDARSNWEMAQAQLKAARDAFNTGAVVRLKEILNKKDVLQTKLSTSKLECEQAEVDFKAAFESAGFEKTATVQKILNKKNDAIAVCEELQAAIGYMQDEHRPIYLQADSEAQFYERAYKAAFNTYCMMRSSALLEKHGPPLIEAIALLRLVPTEGSVHESHVGPNLGYSPMMDSFVLDARVNRILGPLRAQAMAAPVKMEDIVDAVGVLDIAPVDGRKYITPAERHLLSHNVVPSRLML